MSTLDKSILVIDDESLLLVGIKAILERAGYKTYVANDGYKGLEEAKKNTPDLIICDIMMPVMDGFKVREAINDNPDTRDIPFLFLSARTSQADKLKGLGLGADDYLTKPFDQRELIARISAILNRYEKGHEVAQRDLELEIKRFQQKVSTNVSHELRTPMTQILFALDLVLRKKYDNPEDLNLFIKIAMSQTYRLNGIIEDLIFLTNYDRGAVNTFRNKLSVENDFIEPIMHRQEFYESKDLRIQINAPSDIMIHAPKVEFRMAAIHLVDNAMKFSPPKSNILIELAPNGEGGCIISVSDNGGGIPAHLREQVFERYYQISQGDTREYNGLGVGLTIARIVSRALGGDTVILQSEDGCLVQMTISPSPVDFP